MTCNLDKTITIRMRVTWLPPQATTLRTPAKLHWKLLSIVVSLENRQLLTVEMILRPINRRTSWCKTTNSLQTIINRKSKTSKEQLWPPLILTLQMKIMILKSTQLIKVKASIYLQETPISQVSYHRAKTTSVILGSNLDIQRVVVITYMGMLAKCL